MTLKTAGATKAISAILTNATGGYSFTGVPPGRFELSFRYQLMLDGLGFPLVLLDTAASTIDYGIDSRIDYEARRHRDGAIELRAGCTLDLDTGAAACPGMADAWVRDDRADDIWIEPDGRGLYLTPKHGAVLEVRSTTSSHDRGCLAARDIEGRVRVDGLPEGTRICVRTNEGRHAEIEIWPKRTVCVEGDVSIGFVTWKH